MENLIISEVEFQQIVIKNKAEIIAELKSNLEKYNKVLTEETVKEGKEDKAKLNKVIKAIEDKRKEIKKLVMLPYDKVEEDFKEITGLITDVVTNLDKQVKTFEEEEKRVKQEQINKLLELNTTGVKFNNEKWLNATYKLKEIETEIKDFVSKFNQDMELLKDEDVTIKDYYSRTLNISATLIEKKRIEELRKQEEERKQRLLEIKEVKVEVKQEEPVITFEPVQEIQVKNTMTLELKLTYTEITKLKQFLIENNIEYKLKGEIQ